MRPRYDVWGRKRPSYWGTLLGIIVVQQTLFWGIPWVHAPGIVHLLAFTFMSGLLGFFGVKIRLRIWERRNPLTEELLERRMDAIRRAAPFN